MNVRLFVFIFMGISSLGSRSQDLFNYQHSLDFAKYLIEQKDYHLAIEEYNRVLYFNPSDSAGISGLLYCYEQTNQYQKLVDRFEMIYATNQLSNPNTNIYIKSLLLNESYTKAHQLSQNPDYPNYRNAACINLLLPALQKDWDKAYELANQEPSKYPDQLVSILQRQKDNKYKSPALAGMLSTVVPGSGKAYSGNLKDGIFSFLFVGINGWLAYRGFSQKGLSSGLGWGFGALSTGFYAANIFGSAQEAKNYNHRLDEAYKNEILEVVDICFP